MRDVYVSGIGVVAPRVSGAERLFHHIAEGKSCLREAPRFGRLDFPNTAAGYIDDQQWQEIVAGCDTEVAQPRQVLLAECTARCALKSAGLESEAIADVPAGLFVGANKHNAGLENLALLARCMERDGRVDLDKYMQRENGALPPFARRVDQQTCHLAAKLHIRDHISTHSDACAAGTVAIGSAYRAIQRGEIDLAICGSVELMAEEVAYFMFHGLGALCRQTAFAADQQSRPFMKDRAGFVLSEGAAFLVLESDRRVRRRQATPLARVIGYANFCEAEKMTASRPDGSKYARCIHAAVSDAGLKPADITHVNTHGTSTQVNDRCEALALKTVFGDVLETMTFTANKSALGHSLAGAGAIEAALSVLSLRDGILLPTLNYAAADADFPELQFLSSAVRAQTDVVLSNSFGFGGINSAIVLGRA